MGELPPLSMLLDPADDVAVTVGLLQRHDPAAGVIVVHPTPSAGGQASLAHDLLVALGYPVAQLGPEGLGGTERAWRAAGAWTTAEPPRTLVLLRAHTFTLTSLNRLIALAGQAGTELLLVCHDRTLPPALARVLAGVEHEVFTDLHAAAGRHALDDSPVPSPPDDGRADTSGAKLPRSELPLARPDVYRAEAYRRLPPRQFAQLDTHYRYGMDAALAHLHDDPAGTQFDQFLSATTWDSPDRPHTYARIHGMQAGFLWHGHHLKIHAPLPLLCGPGLTSVPFTVDVATRIRAQVAHPLVAAAVAVTYFTGIDAPTASYLRPERIAPDGATMTMNYHATNDLITDNVRHYLRPGVDHLAVFHVPPLARPFLVAARAFLLEHPNRSAARPATMDTKLQDALHRCQINLPHRPYRPRSKLHTIAGTWQLHTATAQLRDPLPGPGHDALVLPPDPATLARAPGNTPYDRDFPGPPSQLDPTPKDTANHLDLIEGYLAARHVPEPAATPDLDDLLFALRLTSRPSPLPWTSPGAESEDADESGVRGANVGSPEGATH